MALERGSGSRLDQEEEERKRREAEGARSAAENEARIRAAIAAYQESERRKEQAQPKPYDPTAGRKYPTQPESPKTYDPTAGAKYPPAQEEERPVYRVERASAGAEQRAREEGERRYKESERAAYTRPDTSKPLLSFLPEPEASRIGLAEPERPDTSTPQIGVTPRSWDTVTFEEPDREPEPLAIPRTLWTPPTLQSGPPILRATPATQALPVVGNLLAQTAPVVAEAAGTGLRTWWQESPWSPRQWDDAWRREMQEAEATGEQRKAYMAAQPGALEAEQRSADRLKAWSADGNLSWWDKAGDTALRQLDNIAAGLTYIGTTPLAEQAQAYSGNFGGDISGAPEWAQRAPLEYAQPIGSAINRAANPKNPNFVPTGPDTAWLGGALSRLDPSDPNYVTPQTLAANLDWFSQEIKKGVAQWDAATRYIDSLPPAQRAVAQRGLINMASGPERTLRGIEYMLNPERRVNQLLADASRAEQEGDLAARDKARLEAYKLQEGSWVDITDAEANPWARFVYEAIFDPTNLMGGVWKLAGGTPAQMLKLLKNQRLYQITDAQAIGQIAKQMERAPQLTKIIGGEAKPVANGILGLFKRTDESNASLQAQRMVEMVVNAFVPIDNREDAARVLASLVQDGGQSLVRGLSGLQTPAIAQGMNGLYRWGAGLIGNAETARTAPLWRALADELPAMRALQGDTFNKTDLLAELGELIYHTTRRAQGLVDPSNLPFGASKLRVKKLNSATGVLEYLDAAGKVFRSGGQMPLAEAQAAVTRLTKARRGFNPIKTAAAIQKAIMSDMFLAFRPANWIRNAASATAMLVSEDSMTLLPHKQIAADLARRFGGVLPWLDANATRETGSGAIDWVARKLTGDPNNPASRIMKWFFDRPYGEGVGGEGWFRMKAKYVAFNRALEPLWKETVNRVVAPRLAQAGIPADLARELAEQIKTLGISGNRDEIATKVRELVGRGVVPVDVRAAFGLVDDDLTLGGLRRLQEVANTYGPERIAEAVAEVTKIIDDARKPYLSVMSETLVQPVVRYTADVIKEEYALVRDMLADMGKRAGVPDAKRMAGEIAKGAIQGTQEQWARMLNDARALPSDKRTADVLNDYFATIYDLRAEARRRVDELGRRAIGASDAERNLFWRQKFEGTAEAYQTLTRRIGEVTDEYRGLLARLAADPAQPYTSARSWDAMVERYMQFDERLYQSLREVGDTLGSARQAPNTYAAVIDAFRGKVDQSFVTLLDAVKRYPTADNFDLLNHAMSMADTYGRRVTAGLGNLSKRIGKEFSQADYYRQRNAAWREAWLDAVLKNNDAVLRQIVENGLSQGTQTPSAKAVKAMAQQIKAAVPEVAQTAQRMTDEAIGTISEQLGIGGEAAAQALRAGDADALRAVSDILGLEIDEGADAVDVLRAALGNHDGMPSLDVGDVAETMLRHLDELENKIKTALPQLLAGKPNTLTAAQRLRVVDMVDDLLPLYDDVLGAAMRTADDMAGWLMLNFNDKRNFDSLLGVLSPFPYFWSRMLPRAVGAALTKPSLVNRYYGAKRAIAQENQQADIPQVRYGTVPNPLPIGPNRIGLGQFIDAIIPGVMYFNPNPFVEPDEASNDTGRWMLNVMRFAPGLLPANQYAAYALLDQLNPRQDGLSWNSGFQLSDVVPVWKMLYYDWMRRTGNIPKNAGGILSGGDEFDYGRIGKGVMLEGMDNTGSERMWGLDVVRQGMTGEQPLPEQWSGAEALAQQGAQRAGGDRLASMLFSYFFGMPAWNDTPEEREARAAQELRRFAGYDPVTNPQGSKAAVDAVDAATGEIGKTYSMYSSLYPQGTALPQAPAGAINLGEDRPVPPTYPYRQPFGDTRPGETAARDERGAEMSAVYDTYGPQLEEATATLDGVNAELATLKEQIDGTPKGDARDPLYAQRDELYARKNAADAARDALFEQRDAEIAKIKGQYPSVGELPAQQEEFIPAAPTGADPTAGTQPQGNIDFYGAYSPAELADAAKENAERVAKAKYKEQAPNWDNQPQRPGKGASDAEWDAYKAAADTFYAGVDEYEALVAAETERLLENPSGLVYGRPTGAPVPEPVSPYAPLRGGSPTVATETSGVVGETDAGPVLLPPEEVKRIRAEERLAEQAAKQGGGTGGATGGLNAPGRAPDFSDYWDAYNKLDDWDAKRKFMQDNPIFEAEYVRWAKKKYGDTWDAWWKRPQFERTTGRVSGSYGGGSWGGYGGGTVDENLERRMDVYIAPRDYDRALMPQPGRIEAWRPPDVNLQWLRAGEALRPDRAARWRLRVNQ